MTTKSVSVIIPTYNRADVVVGTIETALGQTSPNVEVLVVDHGSTDATPQVLEKFGSRINVLRIGDTARGGAAVPRNAGIESAKGDYVAFLDDDDLWDPSKLERQIDFAVYNPGVALVSSNARVIDASGEVVSARYLEGIAAGSGFRELVEENFIIASSVVVKRELLIACGGFDERASLYAIEDYELWLRIAARARISFLDEVMLSYRVHPGSYGHASHLGGLAKRRAALFWALKDRNVRRFAPKVVRGIGRDFVRAAKVRFSDLT